MEWRNQIQPNLYFLGSKVMFSVAVGFKLLFLHSMSESNPMSKADKAALVFQDLLLL